jgi:hypothetical protein
VPTPDPGPWPYFRHTCPNCGRVNDAQVKTRSAGPGGIHLHSLLLCIVCGQWAVVTGRDSVRPLGDDERARMAAQDPEKGRAMDRMDAALALARMEAHADGREWAKP